MAAKKILVSEEIDKKVVTDTENGKTIPQICTAYGLSPRKVIDIRKEYHLDKNHWWEKNQAKKAKSTTFIGELSEVTNTMVERHMQLKATNDKFEPEVQEICLKLLALIEKVKKQ